jgi:anti-sigma regulatory factor (Ser/Thr protein kinase)
VRVETTRTAGALRLRHGVGFGGSARDVVAAAAPFVAAARGRDEPVALAVRPGPEKELAAVPPAAGLPGPAPGRTGAATVPLSRPQGPDHSGQTVAARWARELRALTRGRAGVTVIVEHDPDLDGLDGGFWTELDAALNVALADVPATLLCLYPQLPLHLEVADAARRNHPLVLVDGALRHNAEHRGAREVLTDRGGVPAPAVLGPPDHLLGFDTWQLVEVRDAVARAARAAGCDGDRVADLVLAVNEVATNAVEHGNGDAHLALWTGPGSRELLCEVHDGGRLVDPLPGLHAPHPSDPRGRGLWIARQLCDLLHLWGDETGTHVRIRALP